jgi:hypothetical protein
VDTCGETEPCVYFKVTNGCKFIISVNVDDYIMGYGYEEYFDAFIAHFHKDMCGGPARGARWPRT